MKIEMLRSENGSNDGLTTRRYEHGRTYNVSDELGSAFIADGAAIMSRTTTPRPIKTLGVNKAEAAAENKGGAAEAAATFPISRGAAPVAGPKGRNSGVGNQSKPA